MNGLERSAQRIRKKIQKTAKFHEFTECELVAEIFKQTLEHECDGCHVTWLELHEKLKDVMQPN